MCETAYRIPGATICCSTIGHVTFFTSVDIDPAKGSGILLNFEKQTIGGKIWLEPTPNSVFFQRQNPDIRNHLSLIETCAGIGAMGLGFHKCGIPTACYNDFNPKFCQWLRAKSATPVIEGNVTNPQAIYAVHCAAPDSQFITARVSCQPFLSLGDKREQYDQRSESFTGVLTMSYMLKCLVIFMECTKEALQSAWAQETLNKFCLLTGFQCQQGLLHLHELWPSFRTRWWAVLHHPSICLQSMPPVPKMVFEPSIIHLIPRLRDLPPEEIAQLALSLHEYAMFGSQPKGILGSVIDLFKPMPTATHSWGSQCQECFCGCRSEGFAASRIRERGLYGQLAPIEGDFLSNHLRHASMRHLHPQEVALLCGLPRSYVTPTPSIPLKLELAGVGQLASPIQSTWMCANVLHAMGVQGIMPPQPSPHQQVGCMLKTLIEDRNRWWDCTAPTTTMSLFIQGLETMFGESFSDINFTQEVTATIAQWDVQCHAPSQESPSTAPASEVTPLHAADKAHPEHPLGRVPSASEHPTPVPHASEGPVSRACPVEQSVSSEGHSRVQWSTSPVMSGSVHDARACDPAHDTLHAKPLLTREEGPSLPHAGPDMPIQAMSTPGIMATPGDQNASQDFHASHVNHEATKLPKSMHVELPVLHVDNSCANQTAKLAACESHDPVHLYSRTHAEGFPPRGQQALPLMPREEGPSRSTELQPTELRSRSDTCLHQQSAKLRVASIETFASATTPPFEGEHGCPIATLQVPGLKSATDDHHDKFAETFHDLHSSGHLPELSPPMQNKLHYQETSGPRFGQPSHVTFQAMPHLPRDEGPSLTSSIATTDPPSNVKRRRLDAVPPQQAYNSTGGINSFAASPLPSTSMHASHEVESSDPDFSFEPAAYSQSGEELIPAPIMDVVPGAHKITAYVAIVGDTPHEIQVMTGTTVGQLVVATGRLEDPNITWRPTDPMGQAIPIASEITQDQVVFLSNIAFPFPKFTFEEHEYALGCRTSADRIQVLWNQQGWVASDEMAFYLRNLDAWGLPTTPPIVATNAVDMGQALSEWVMAIVEEANAAHKKITRRTAVLLERHWTPVMISIHNDILSIHTTPVGRQLFQSLPELQMFDEAIWHIDTVTSRFSFDCGFQAFAWLHGYAAGDIATPMSIVRANAMRREFADHCRMQATTLPFALGGALDEKHVPALQALLESHGVAQSRSHAVALHLLSVLGAQSVGQTLQSHRPWRDLKTKANQQKPPIQLVLAEELKAKVDERAKSGQAIGKRGARKPHQAAKSPIVLRADQIPIPDAIFQQQDGTQIGQLTIHQIQGNARGVVVVNVQDALPFFQLQEAVSTEGIALLILDHTDPRIPAAQQTIKFPAHFTDTDEPILVTAAMVQIGAKQVQRHKPDSCVKIDQVQTQVIRLLAYRDQLKLDWASLAEGPIRALLGTEFLAFMSQDQILDIWDRQYLDKSFKKVQAKDAYLFAATFRLQVEAAHKLLDMSGKEGLYTEPRTDNGRSPHPDFRVIWLPRKSYTEAALINQTTSQQTWLVRNGERLGLRVHESDASEVHTQHRPEISYLDGTSVQSYKVGPFPWGTTKHGLQKVFTQWKWPARPGQPQGQASDGVFWSAQATQHPSHWVYTMDHGDVLVSHNDPIKAAKTLKQLTMPAKKAEQSTADPWLTHDPWSHATLKPSPASLTQVQLAQMQNTIEQNLREHLVSSEDASMDSANDSRVAALEDQVKQLATSVGLVLGTFNPTGLMHKSAFFSELPKCTHAIWGISETHVTQQGVNKFKAELRFNHGEFSFYPGPPVPPRSSAPSAVGGKQVGVGFLATMPAKKIANDWPQELRDSCRVMSQTFRYCDQWVHGAVFYGPAKGSETAAVRAEADEMLSHVTNQIVHGMKGKRFILGDLNQLHGQLSQTDIWSKLGWKEIQDLEESRTGKKPVNTCKNSTRKDFVWISPELQPYWLSTEVRTLAFKDHAVLSAMFQPFGKPETVPLWRKPKSIPWTKIKGDMPAGNFTFSQVDPATFCHSLAVEFESRANHMSQKSCGQPLLDCQRGRSATSSTVMVPESQCQLSPGRHGDAQPKYFGTHMTYKRWFKQLRRLEAFARGAQKQSNTTPTKAVHQTREWRAILHASCFPKKFQVWWACRPHRYPGVPYDLPHNPITADQATLLCHAFEAEVRALEDVLIQELKAKARAAHSDNPNKVFKDTQKPQVSPVQLLTDFRSAKVLEVDPEELAVTLEAPVQFASEQPLMSSQGLLHAVVMEEDKLWLEDLKDLQPGDELSQENHIGDLASLFERFGTEWSARWDKHRDTPSSFWDPLLDFIDTAIPEHAPMPYERITAAQIHQVIKSKKPTAATGPDGWSRQDILRMAPDLLQSIADMFTWIESGHHWPISCVTGIIHSLEKRAEASQVQHYRPITIFSLIYRAWSSIRSRQILAFLTDRVPQRCFGNVPKKTAKDVWFGIQQQIEDHYFTGRPLTGCMLDLVKAFNDLPRLPIMKVGVVLGIPTEILHSWSSALHVMERRFFIRGATGPVKILKRPARRLRNVCSWYAVD
eukprot:s1234_g10.t2